MKKLILALLIVMLAAGTAYAVDVKVVKGAYYVRGAHWANHADPANMTVLGGAVTKNDEEYMAYDHDMDLYIDFVVDETTKVITYFELADEEPWDGYKSNNPGGTGYDDNIELKRIYLEHKFGTGTVLSVGKMTAGTWSTVFMDNEGPGYRVKVIQFFPWGLIGGLAQKLDDQGYSQKAKDGEKDDGEAYALFGVFNAGPVSIQPLWFHIILANSVADQDDDDLILDYYSLGLMGNFGMIGFEAEYGYINSDYDDSIYGSTMDNSLSGIYVNVWANLEAMKFGFLYAWTEFDEDTGMALGTGADFDETYIMGEELEGGPGDLGLLFGGSSGWSIYQLYAKFAFGQFSLSPSLTYYDSTVDNGAGYWRDSSAFEYNIGAAYKITDSLTYDVGLGVLNIDLDPNYGGDDPDDLVYAFHRIKVAF